MIGGLLEVPVYAWQIESCAWLVVYDKAPVPRGDDRVDSSQ